MFAIPPTRSNCMDHIFAGQVVSLCDFCAACLAALQRTALCKQPRSGGTMKAAVHTATAQKRRLAALTIASTLIFVMSFLIICKGIAYSSPFCTSLNMLFCNSRINISTCAPVRNGVFIVDANKNSASNCFYLIRRKRRQRLDIPIKFFRHNHSDTMIFFICHFCRRVCDNLSNRNNSSSFGIKKSIMPFSLRCARPAYPDGLHRTLDCSRMPYTQQKTLLPWHN